jgi:hypothetical protein
MKAFIVLLAACACFAQTKPAAAPVATPVTLYPLPSDTVFAAMLWTQTASPPFAGKFGYAHLLSAASGIYSYSDVSFTVQKSPVQLLATQETGLCQHTSDMLNFHMLLCGTAGVTESQTTTSTGATTINVGFNPGGLILATRAIGSNGWWWGIVPGISKATTSPSIQYMIGLVIGWGK